MRGETMKHQWGRQGESKKQARERGEDEAKDQEMKT